MLTIKFRTPQYKDGKFYKFTYWGKIDENGVISKDCFSAPTKINNITSLDDEIFIRVYDKNNTEIYENDIIEMEVDFKKERYVVCCLDTHSMLQTKIPYFCNIPFLLIHHKDIEVIGNIHTVENLKNFLTNFEN